jgi:hypothetical protein
MYYSAGVVAVNSTVVGLAPLFTLTINLGTRLRRRGQVDAVRFESCIATASTVAAIARSC